MGQCRGSIYIGFCQGNADALERELQPLNLSVPLDIKKEETDVGVVGTKVLAIHEAREKVVLEVRTLLGPQGFCLKAKHLCAESRRDSNPTSECETVA